MLITYLFNLTKGLTLDDSDEINFYDTASQLYQQMGAIFDTTPDYRNVLGLRKFTPVTKENKKGLYDDSIWSLWISKKGIKHATEYESNTEPSYWYFGTDGQHANDDKKLDLGRLPTGVYKYSTVMVSRDKLGMVFRLTQEQRVERDINHDGNFDEADVKLITNESAMIEGRTMHFHKGNRDRTASAGCQTLRSDYWTRFVKDIEAGRQAGQMEFTYVLMNKG